MSLSTLLVAGRPGLEIGLQLTHSMFAALRVVHAKQHTVGALSSSAIRVTTDGAIVFAAECGERVAPELRDGSAADSISDLYSAAWVAYEVLTGRTPRAACSVAKVFPLHDVPAPSALNPSLDERIDQLLLSVLATDPGERPHSVGSVLEQLNVILAELELEPSALAIQKWVTQTSATRPRLIIVPSRPVTSDEDLDEGTEENQLPDPPKFDAWGIAAAAVAITGVLIMWVS